MVTRLPVLVVRLWSSHLYAQAPVTFSRDIAPIVFAKCAGCHPARPGRSPAREGPPDDCTARSRQELRASGTARASPRLMVRGTTREWR